VQNTRKAFLRNAAAILAGSAASPVLTRRPANADDDRYAVLLPATETYEAITSDSRGYSAGKYVLVIDGVSQGPVHSVEGGHATSDVVTEKLGPDTTTKKHIGNVKYDDVTFKCGLDTPSALSDWLKAALNKSAAPKNVTLIGADSNNSEVEEQQFTHALITEIGFPACDASSKDAAYLQVKFSPEVAKQVLTNKGKPVSVTGGSVKNWIPANFRLTIPGVDCTKVSKIEAITWKGKASSASAGAPTIGGSSVAAGGGSVSNLVVTVATSSAKDFLDWQKNTMLKGAQAAQLQKTGALDFMSSNLQSRVASLALKNLMLFKMTADKTGAPGDTVQRMTIEMTVEAVSMTTG
jgi:phage tail-like protein